MEGIGQDWEQMEIEEVESSRMDDEETKDVKVFQDGSSSSSSALVAAPTAGRIENDEGGDGQGLKDNPQLVPMETGSKIFGMLSDEDVEGTLFDFPKAIPFLLMYLSKNDLLNCHAVCSSWRDGLDIGYYARHSEVYHRSKGLAAFIGSTNKITRFLQKMESHPGSPFAGKNIRLLWNFPPLPEQEKKNRNFEYFGYFFPLFKNYWNNSVIQLLDVFGHHVHFMSIDMTKLQWFEENSPGELYNWNFPQLLQRILERVPNLRKWEMCGNFYDGAWIIEDNKEAARRRRMRLPQMANLEALAISGQSDGMIDSILESACDPNKIKRVDLYSYGRGFANAVLGFQNLEFMDVGLTLDNLDQFRTLKRPPPLKKIAFRFYFPMDFVDFRNFVDFQRFAAVLEVFASTLKVVDVTCTPFRVVGEKLRMKNEQKGFRINLPKLEKISWDNYVGPLDPFIQLPSLKHLDFNFEKLLRWKKSEVQLYGFEERMESSNIWTLIPSLNKLAIKGRNVSGKFEKSYDRCMLLEFKGKEMGTSQEGK